MREVRVLAEAALGVIEAAAYYEAERPGLGEQFERAVHDSLALLRADVVPLASISANLTELEIRRLVMRRYPYSVIVREVGDAYEVIAFAHHARQPGYWRNRSSR